MGLLGFGIGWWIFGMVKLPAGVQLNPPEAKSLPSRKSLSLDVLLPHTLIFLFCTENSCGVGAGGKLPCFSGFLGELNFFGAVFSLWFKCLFKGMRGRDRKFSQDSEVEMPLFQNRLQNSSFKKEKMEPSETGEGSVLLPPHSFHTL